MAENIEVYLADFMRDQERIEALRMRVFVQEQGVPEDQEMDERDLFCQHFLACCDGVAIGTARLDLELKGKMGRLAVLQPYRRRGVGRQLIERIHQSARESGLSEIWCHAQLSAQNFYSVLGYEAEGTIFEEAGIEHVTMRYTLVK
ncbi:GNAT family N-acetyltransferase [Acidithiobacillus thiooxidans]|uniref:GNAT family acetyltransferase n=2 Tax=Acidithiobacillus TaxID=119977 RepID=A0A1C2IYZ7_ACITH|nr:GNAT family N-acetyltransferase [Acidithiobacillus thiooxidans]MBU2812281.1 GNAT family N-acetyltransferase [Acidithiobacillus thiooxidans]MBU2843856.1 GNAT family N-acetyltransferase [Acidithiobacillus thiooxidans]OCX69308.1 GNAT family acetyltransferase [Acidithiobacillus thiooxidans]OCX72966.1 GNAT family acetyltransferase [Acidithiobacillus thiooxidans]OCX74220.1 GNAT family acetyltransferase [Acidithiobacillus thiooxidans]